MTDLFFGPYKDTMALYIVKFGDFDTVVRIRYTGSVDAMPEAGLHPDTEMMTHPRSAPSSSHLLSMQHAPWPNSIASGALQLSVVACFLGEHFGSLVL